MNRTFPVLLVLLFISSNANAASISQRLPQLEAIHTADQVLVSTVQELAIVPTIVDPISLSFDFSGVIDSPLVLDANAQVIPFHFTGVLSMSGPEWNPYDPGGSNFTVLIPLVSLSDTQSTAGFRFVLEPDGHFRYSFTGLFNGLGIPSLSSVNVGLGFTVHTACPVYVLLPCPSNPPFSFYQPGSVSVTYAAITLSDQLLSPDLTRTVPEPLTSSLLALGILSLAARRMSPRPWRNQRRPPNQRLQLTAAGGGVPSGSPAAAGSGVGRASGVRSVVGRSTRGRS
ncbi:MAG: hypothetical protein OZ948_05290 [Deltaproteobacteria bacterium]|nr:hypothetical protein [Deltaproteobacteria bacterium]